MRTLVLAAFAATLTIGAAALQASAAPPPATSTTKATVRGPAGPRTAISLDCSKQADAKSLHGKDREKFRRSCMKTK